MDKIKIEMNSINKEKKDKLILKEKQKGYSDFEIGKKYGVSYKYIEELVTRKKGVNINDFRKKKTIKSLIPKDFQIQKSTVWSFKQRGSWATHSGKYRGNWSPYIPRNIILKYSKQGDLVLDYFCGAGTTAVESKLLGRKCIALDINPHAVELAKENSNFEIKQESLIDFKDQLIEVYEPKIFTGDAKNLLNIKENTIDLICAHPPYANIVQYTDNKKDDLSFLDVNDFLKEMEKVARESFRVLKPGHQCAILIGDTRKKKHVIPLGFGLVEVFLRAGFQLRELIIKRQHNCKTTGFWYNNSIKYNFLLLAHEYLPVFEKPEPITKSLANGDYENMFPYLTLPKTEEKINAIETTTVWLLPTKDFEKYLNKNIISRYSPQNNYLTYSFSEKFNEDSKLTEKKKIDLLYIKFPTGKKEPIDIDGYEKNIKRIIDNEIDYVEFKGFIVIQTRDVRKKDGYIMSLAKRIQESIKDDRLWLKEIIIATIEKSNMVNNNETIGKCDNGYLSIYHCYLLVYEKVK